MNTETVSAYKAHLKRLEALPFEMGLPEEIVRVKQHIKSLQPNPLGEWDGDLGAYDSPTKTEHIDL